MADRVTVRLLYDTHASIGESPLYRDGQLWWTDPVKCHLLHGNGVATSTERTARPVWSLAALPNGEMAAALDDRFAIFSEDGRLVEGPLADVALGCRFNDMTVSPDGVVWVGTMHRGILASSGAIYRADTIDSEPLRVASGLGVPNGMKLSSDGAQLFVIDTLQRTLLAYPVVDDGLGEPTIVTDFLGLPGKPDGMALAPDGAFWVAMWGGAMVVEIAPNGATLRQIEVPARHVSSVCLAGEGRLLVSTSRMRLSPIVLEEEPHSGGVFEVLLENGR